MAPGLTDSDPEMNLTMAFCPHKTETGHSSPQVLHREGAPPHIFRYVPGVSQLAVKNRRLPQRRHVQPLAFLACRLFPILSPPLLEAPLNLTESSRAFFPVFTSKASISLFCGLSSALSF